MVQITTQPDVPDEPTPVIDPAVGGKGGNTAHNVAATGDQGIDGLLGSTAWSSLNITYSFPTSSDDYGTSDGAGTGQYPDPAPFSGFSPLTQTQEADVQRAFALISSYTNLTFTQITETTTTHATLRLANSSVPPSAYAYLPSNNITGGDVFFGGTGQDPVMGNFDSGAAVLHEIGHALGLKHGQDNEQYGTVPANLLSNEYSLMNYPAYVGDASTNGSTIGPGSAPQSFMMYDIAALQYMYGANFGNAGTSLTYTWSPTTGEELINGVAQGVPFNNHIFQTVWTGGATATYDLSNFGDNGSLDMRPGGVMSFSSVQIADLGYYSADGPGTHMASGNVYNALLYNGDTRSEISGLDTGNGNDVVTGNDVFDTIRLGSGTDTVNAGSGGGLYYAGSGTDVFNGGAGDDYFNLAAAASSDMLDGGGGHNTAIFADDYASYTLAASGSALTVSDAGITDTLNNIQTLQFADRVVQTNDLPCFAAGTRLATPRGMVAVENLHAGDAVLTADGGIRPVRWIGRSRVDCTRHPHPERVRPVRVAAHAFGPGLPARDLLLSPDHAIFADSVLIPIKRLENGDSVRQIDAASVTYFHVELDAHDVVLAEGLPAESYLDTGNRQAFANGGSVAALHPDFTRGESLAWEALSCAPLVVTGAPVERVRARLACREARPATATA
jgi:serralysin